TRHMPTILVLDDDEIILDLLKTVLGDAGYETILAPEVSRIPPKASADLVITDLVLSRAYRREEALAWVTTLRKRFGGSPLRLVLLTDAVAEGLLLGVILECPNHREDRGRLLPAHDADPRVRPHPELPRRVGASRHAVVPGPEAAADDDRELGHGAAGDRGNHFRAVLRDAARLVLLADHEA